MATVQLAPTYIGQDGDTAIYRIDLAASGLSTIREITIHDDNVISGWNGSHSGFDLDFVRVSNSSDWSTAKTIPAENVFNFSASGVVFRPGFLQPGENGNTLLGTTEGNVYNQNLSTLHAADGRDDQETGALSLGEGGQITFLLNAALSSGGRFLYFGDTGGNSEGAYVLVSDGPTSTNEFTLVGTSGNDTIRLGVGPNAHLQFTNNTVSGGRGNDKIYGAFGNDTLRGDAGNDFLAAGGGNDWLYGGAGNDRLYGQAGSDAFVFNTKLSARSNVDRIHDYNVKLDSIYLENAIFTKVGRGSIDNPKKINKNAFWKGDAAHDRSDRIIYDKDSGALYYDRDGTGAASQVKFAQLSKNLKMTYHDFFVI